MQTREVIPLLQPLDLVLTLPGSKSITNRAFLCAALATGKSRITGALESDDTAVMMTALQKLGVKVRRTKSFVEITGGGGRFKPGNLTLDLHNAGTATRFLTALMVLRDGETVITGDARMRERPIDDLSDALRQLGATVEYLGKAGCPPLRIAPGEQDSGHRTQPYLIRTSGAKSSQFFSALLMLAPLLSRPTRIEVIGELVSKPYIDTTIAVLKSFGIRVTNNDYQSFFIKPQVYKACDYVVEGDASAASYWSAINYLHGGHLKFENLNYKKSIQGDVNFPMALGKLGRGAINMNAMPDAAMTLAVCAPFVKGKTKIAGLSTLRHKETDRLAAMEAELKKVGVTVRTTKDSITIEGNGKQKTGHRKNIQTYHDHRMAMSFAVLGTMAPGIVIEDPGCVDKTYPHFWEDLERAYLSPIKLGKKNLVLIGMRGSGKSFYGRKISHLLKRKFFDLDREIEKAEGMPVAEIVKQKGWPHFRAIEKKVCQSFRGSQNLVIATGGGVVLDPANMRALKSNSVTVFIFADPSVLAVRLKQSKNRPPLKKHDPVAEVQSVWLERRNLYLQYADRVWDDTGGTIIQSQLRKIFIGQ